MVVSSDWAGRTGSSAPSPVAVKKGGGGRAHACDSLGNMTLPSLYEFLGTPAMELEVDVSTARTASLEGVDPPGVDSLGVPSGGDGGTYQTRSDGETYDDHASVGALGISATGTELTHADGETYDVDLGLGFMDSNHSIRGSTVFSKSDSETFDEDSGRDGLGVPS